MQIQKIRYEIGHLRLKIYHDGFEPFSVFLLAELIELKLRGLDPRPIRKALPEVY